MIVYVVNSVIAVWCLFREQSIPYSYVPTIVFIHAASKGTSLFYFWEHYFIPTLSAKLFSYCTSYSWHVHTQQVM